MNQCKKCGSLTKNKKFCSKKCQFDYKKKKKSKLEFFIYEQIKKDFYHLDIIQNDRTVLNENLELDLYIPKNIIMDYPDKYIPKGTKFLVCFIGGNINNCQLIGRVK